MCAPVLPAEVATLPHVGPAIATTHLGRAALERERLTRGVERSWCGVAQERAEIQEVLLRCRAFGQLDPLPLGDELRSIHSPAIVSQQRRLPRRRNRAMRCDWLSVTCRVPRVSTIKAFGLAPRTGAREPGSQCD